MLKEIIHIGITVSDMERSLKFYQDVLGLTFAGKLIMEGEATDKLFAMENCKALVYYLNGSDKIDAPPLELIQFLHIDVEKQRTDLARTSASEICFKVDDIDAVYQKLLANNVECLSEPQFFDFTEFGFAKSKALYFYDPDGIIIELIEEIKE